MQDLARPRSMAHSSRRSLKRLVLMLGLVASLFLLCTTASSASGDGPSFTVARKFGTETGPAVQLDVGDMDGDGDLDLVIPDGVYLNDGTGTFAPIRPVDVYTDYGGNVAIGDMDRDGDLDLVAPFDRAQYAVYFNDGQVNFQQGPPLGPSWPSTHHIGLGDMDGDGNLDIVASTSGHANVVYLNDGKGSFPESRPFGSALDVYMVEDMDGDDDLDVIVQNLIYLNDGAGNFPQSRPFGTSDDATSILAAGDMDGDGDVDLVAVGYGAGSGRQTIVHLNDGAANFSESSPIGTPSDSTMIVAVGDMDGDGDLDLVTGNAGQDFVHLNDGKGNFPQSRAFGSDMIFTTAITVGDMDGDGDMDIAASNQDQHNVVHLNDGGGSFRQGHAIDGKSGGTYSVALADMDGDGDLDLVVGNWAPEQSSVYLNDGTGKLSQSLPFYSHWDFPASMAVGDIDGDGDLDIAFSTWGQDLVHLNDGTGNFPESRPFGSENDSPWSITMGDMDGDSDLDLVLVNRIYLNDGRGSFPESRPFGIDGDGTRNVKPGDVDGDGDLDLVSTAGMNSEGYSIPHTVHLNDGTGNFPQSRRFSSGSDHSLSLALGDMNGDGALDVVTGNQDQNTVYLNDGTGNFPTERDFGPGPDSTYSVSLGDVDGDGDLDIAAGNYSQQNVGGLVIATGNYGQQNVIYLNDGMGNFSAERIFGTGPTEGGVRAGVAMGDLDRDGDTDLVSISSPQNLVYLNGLVGATTLPNNPPRVAVSRPGSTPDANFYSTPTILSDRTISIRYTLTDPEGDPVRYVRAFYSPDGGGRWLPAVAATGSPTSNLTASRTGTSHTYRWDTFASGFFGQSDNVVFRIEAYTDLRPRANAGVGPFQRPYSSAQTFPFRVRGTQMRVMQDGKPAANALIYRLPAGDATGGTPMGTGGVPFRTNAQGYLSGRGALGVGDRLLAMLPIRSTESYTLYYTNGTPTEAGLKTDSVTAPGVQELNVSKAHPLLLFNLHVSLEWDARNDPIYLQQLEADLRRASKHLYDFTDGQVALGKITIHQNADDWAYSDVLVHATNRLRPFAVQGGIVLKPTVDPQRPDVVYDTGQVHMGATWNRYGTPGSSLGEDWSIILAHELSHYLLFQDDTYLGFTANGLLKAVDTCTGSAMGEIYIPDNTEFVADEGHWQANCADTLANKTLGRDEWATLKLWYPELVRPTAPNSGPPLKPFDLTEVTVLDPINPNAALDDPTFFLHYAGGTTGSSEGRAFLLRDDYLVDLGSPSGGQNRVLARGASPGDRLCIFDRLHNQYGCEIITNGDRQLALEQDTSWRPVLQLTPVTSTTFGLEVHGLPPGLRLKARLFPEYGPSTGEITLGAAEGIYKGTLPTLEYPAMTGHVQLWVDETATESDPRRESVVAYAVGGNPGWTRGSGGWTRGSGGWTRGSGGWTRGSGAPLISPDGQMTFAPANSDSFEVGDFYTIQGMAALPPLPPGKVVIGQGYNLIASPQSPQLAGSISFHYLGNDALMAKVDENDLRIHFWDGNGWQVLATLGDPYYNLASAHSRGAGIYALMAGATTPQITSVSPRAAMSGVTTSLAIKGGYFLQPVQVALVGAGGTYALPVQSVSPTTITASVSAGVPAGEFRVRVVNGDGTSAPVAGMFALYAPGPPGARFYDYFESGAGGWERRGTWDIAVLPSGERAMTDSPGGNYDSALAPSTSRTTAITSCAFDLTDLANPALTFRHDYLLAKTGTSQDVARVEISSDDGGTWRTLASYSGGGIYGQASASIQEVEAREWTNVNWKTVQIDLGPQSGKVRLRFSLEVDQHASDKGWVIDDVVVRSREAGSSPGLAPVQCTDVAAPMTYLPMIRR